ncbi:hypothetical protein [Streptomyces niveus]|uniref:hypothetical protein n=1 Tax=Streptomyces niveus TaxID=193462 RepID=UPI0036D2C1AE
MPGRPTRALQAAHTAGALLLGLTAIQHAAAALWPQAVAATVLTGLLAEGRVREREHAAARRQLAEHQLAAAIAADDVTPAGHAAALTDELVIAWQQLHDSCCLNAWLTNNDEHDPTHCTRTENR